MKSLLVLFAFFSSYGIRLLRWLSIVQQKEYRLDRIILFLKTPEGQREFLRLLPQKKDFSKFGLKRPKITPRILIISSIIFVEMLIIVYLLVAVAFQINGLTLLFYLLSSLFIILLAVPLLVILAITPTSFLVYIRVLFELFKAKRKIDKVKPIIIGITGSYGKTSTKILLAHVLGKKYSVFKTPKSYNTKFSVAKSINDNFSNQKIAIIEYAAYKIGEIRLLANWFKPNLAVITGLTSQHLGLFGSLESIIQAKSELLRALAPESLVFVNGSDMGVLKIIQASKRDDLKIIKTDNEVSGLQILKTGLNKSGRLHFVWNGQQVNTKFIGIHYLEIIKIAILIAKKFNMTDSEIVDALSSFVPDDKFIFSFVSKNEFLIIDDGGTTNPKGFSAVIDLANELNLPKKVLITSGIVDLGIESSIIHRELAVLSKKTFDKVLFVGLSGINEFSQVFGDNLLSDQDKIIKYLLSLDKNFVVIIEGRMPGWVQEYLK
ncbi:MAG: hypothetical protein H6772_01275 [Pseudomonadales bacterium]|nr:hypothetical protein [Pseudomonadales bacterium]